jgi:aspartate aminotransferase-like enzyme
MIVDAVTSLGAVNLPIDDWGIDVVVWFSKGLYDSSWIGICCR